MLVAVKRADGKVLLHQSYSLPTAGAVGGGFWGLLIGVLFMNPLLGIVAGAAAGATAGALSDIGIEDHFMKELAATLRNGSSALFVLVRKATPDKVLEALQGTGGKVLKTSLSHEDESHRDGQQHGGDRVDLGRHAGFDHRIDFEGQGRAAGTGDEAGDHVIID